MYVHMHVAETGLKQDSAPVVYVSAFRRWCSGDCENVRATLQLITKHFTLRRDDIHTYEHMYVHTFYISSESHRQQFTNNG